MAHAHHSHGDAEDYAKSLESMRREKDEFFKRSPHSPVPHDERHGFGGLRYFPVDAAYRVPARFVSHSEPELVVMQTSTGDAKEYLNIGHLEFEVKGDRLKLETYWHEGAPSLFVPFRDKTSGKETYGAGRYLDIEWEGPEHEYVVDFNVAYNPFCAYSEDFTCPFPPPQNWLQVPIEAGEKDYPKAE